jgi:hypothetical protein
LTDEERHQALREQYRRLAAICNDIIGNARPSDAPEVGQVDSHLIRRLRRELAHEPHPQAISFSTMSVS